ncbi:MAG TPA: choice-of-anchor D domain-containing protein [Candidatus Binataceae bacterium]|nr:choice-of-anchor D domain-containing protein [Candidatus Binataceae bacterium]
MPIVLDFGNCRIGQRGLIQTAWLANPFWNNGPLSIGSIAIQGSSDFSIVAKGTTCKSTLGVGQVCAIEVQFDPLAGGSRIAKLVVQDNAQNSPQVVYLLGLGELRLF